MTSPLTYRFTPTVADYGAATQTIARRALGWRKWVYFIGLIAAGGLLIWGFILLVDIAFYMARLGETSGRLGLHLVLAGGYLLLGLVLWVRLYLRRRTYVPGGYFLAERVVDLTETGIVNQGGISRIELTWAQTHGWFEDKRRFYILLEPAFALFIPKTAVGDEAALRSLLGSKAKPAA